MEATETLHPRDAKNEGNEPSVHASFPREGRFYTSFASSRGQTHPDTPIVSLKRQQRVYQGLIQRLSWDRCGKGGSSQVARFFHGAYQRIASQVHYGDENHFVFQRLSGEGHSVWVFTNNLPKERAAMSGFQWLRWLTGLSCSSGGMRVSMRCQDLGKSFGPEGSGLKVSDLRLQCCGVVCQ